LDSWILKCNRSKFVKKINSGLLLYVKNFSKMKFYSKIKIFFFSIYK
jgi:hypothetical protein